MEIPTAIDATQMNKKIKVPEIRVWCHPERVGDQGSDFYYVFDTFIEALAFCKTEKIAEKVPLIAYNGYEINIFGIGGDKNEDE